MNRGRNPVQSRIHRSVERRRALGADGPDLQRYLVEAGILKQVTVGRRNRAFEAPELIEAFAALVGFLSHLRRRLSRNSIARRARRASALARS